jgi:protease-4
MGSMAASGGYYIAAPADKIYANRNTWTGSIGVIVGTLFDVSEFLEKYGIKATDITSGPNKAMGSNYEPLTEEQRAIYQSLVDEAYDQFVRIVAEGRGMDIATAKKIADGRIYSAKQAKANGLIDEIMTREDFNKAVKKEYGDEDIAIEKQDYTSESSIIDFFIEAKATPEQTDLSKVIELTEANNTNPLKYLYEG